jgi:hypothetical protein
LLIPVRDAIGLKTVREMRQASLERH